MMIHYIVGGSAVFFVLALVVTQFAVGLHEAGILNSTAFDSGTFAMVSSFFVYYAIAAFVLFLVRFAVNIESPLQHLVPALVSILITVSIYVLAKPNGSVWSMSGADVLKMPGFGVLTTIENLVPSPSDRERRK